MSEIFGFDAFSPKEIAARVESVGMAKARLPLVPMLRDLAATGYDGPLSLELFNPGYWALPIEENLHRGMATTRAALTEAGLL